MSCYFLAQITVHDQAEYDLYLSGFDDIFARYAGTVVAVDDTPRLLEGSRHGPRTVLIRFPDEEEARRWYDSPEYQRLAGHRRRGSTADVVLFTGRE